MHPSWFCAPLDGLAEAPTALLLQTAFESRFSWQDEPGTWRWILTRDGEALTIRILRFADAWSKLDDSKGELVFSAETDPLRFAILVRGLLKQIMHDLGAEKYKELSRYEFPFSAYERLNAVIEAKKAKVKDPH